MIKIAKHPSLQHAEDLQQICQPLSILGISYFSHVLIENNTFSAIGMKPEFVKIYYEKQYYNTDIHRAKIADKAKYILWDGVQRDPELKDLYDDFKSFNLGHIFTITQQIGDCKHYYNFSAPLADGQINHTYLENMDFLNNFILYFTEKINGHKELIKAYDIKSIMKPNEEMSDDNLKLPLKKIYLTHNQSITFREFECLRGLASGKLIEEIAAELSITTRTMNGHIANIKEKLNCNNLFQLGAIYMTLCEQKNILKFLDK